MRTLSQRYKDYELRVKEGQEKANIKISRLDSHTYLVGEELLICEECGKHTKNLYLLQLIYYPPIAAKNAPC